MAGKQFFYNHWILVVGILVSVLVLFSCDQQVQNPQNLPVTTANINQAQSPGDYIEGELISGALYRIYMPAEWNGDLVVFAHGYVSSSEPVTIPEDQLVLPDGTEIPGLVNDLGYAFATTSYRYNGLIVGDAISDLVELVFLFNDLFPDAQQVYLIGASEGGLITVKAVERPTSVFSGGMAVCGPVGDFRKQINYFGDFRVLFDYFFPQTIPGSPMEIPAEVQQNWDEVYVPLILSLISANPDLTLQLLRVAGAAFDPNDQSTIAQTVLGLLWYNVFATNDAIRKLGGIPFDNMDRLYHGSANDVKLNRTVQRFKAAEVAVDKMNKEIDTNGQPRLPLVTMHTLGDPIVPGWHERLYKDKIIKNGDPALHNNIPIPGYGHCNFEKEDVLAGFTLLVLKVTGQELLAPIPDFKRHTKVFAQ